MIQDIGSLRLDNQYVFYEIENKDYVLAFEGKQMQVKDFRDGDRLEYEFVKYGDVRKLFNIYDCCMDFIYLFSIGGNRYFLYVGEEKINSKSVPVYNTRRSASKVNALAAATAYHLYMWYRDNRFCGRCGAKTIHHRLERAKVCEKCGNMIFPKIAPAVIAGVINDDKLLLTTYAGREYKRYALVAGFAEIGETAEETVAREVMEETGIKVTDITYYKSQPWGYDSNLLMGFFARAVNTDIKCDEEELASAQWVSAEDIPDYGENLSLTHEMMQVFKNKTINI